MGLMNFLTSVFGAALSLSPKREVWILFSGSVTAVFGERVHGSPNMEFWMGLVDFLTSFFGDHRICRRKRRMGVYRGL